jgi:peroxiredoxin
MAKNTIECPVCGISVKVENVENHLRKVHPGKKVDIEELNLPKVKKPKARAIPGTRTWPKWAALVVVLIIVAVAVVLSLPQPAEEVKQAPNIEFNDPEGNHFSLNSHIGSTPILLEFFHTGEEDSEQHAFILQNLSASFGNDLLIFSLSPRTVDEVRYFRDSRKFDWTFASVPAYVLDTYDVANFPSVVIIDKKGIIKVEETGVVPLDVMEGWVAPLT